MTMTKTFLLVDDVRKPADLAEVVAAVAETFSLFCLPFDNPLPGKPSAR
jgi:hypothetical protein